MKSIGLIVSLFGFLLGFGQNQTLKTIVPPAEVSAAFEKEFPKMKPIWSFEFEGEDHDQPRYEATFVVNKSNTLAAYDKLGNLKAVETAIGMNELPLEAVHYLRNHNYEKSTTELAKVTDSIKTITYEVGIKIEDRFYDLVFDVSGNFLQKIEIDN